MNEVHCLDDLCHVVHTSTQRGINRAQIVGTEDGEVKVPVYNWQQFFDGWFRALQGIKSHQHSRFSSRSPGKVFIRKRLEDAEKEINLASDAETVRVQLARLPPPIPPPGVTGARREYLYTHIRPFVRPGVQDRVCSQ